MSASKLPETLITYPNLSRLADAVLSIWPEHADFLALRFAHHDDVSLPIAETLSRLILELSGDDIDEYCRNYKWMCANLMREEINFRKTGSYRLKTFDEAYDEVYSRPEYMKPYLNGLLLSQVLWYNQSAAITHFIEALLPSVSPGNSYLEIGPGHGLFLYFAAKSNKFSSLQGWDISQTSINETRHALQTLGITQDISLMINDILSEYTGEELFDTVVISEVLEHLQDPEIALKTLHRAMSPEGRVFINVPVNSPAPDHIYLWNTPEKVVAMVEGCGFSICEVIMEPMTGYDLESARRRKLTISVVIIAARS